MMEKKKIKIWGKINLYETSVVGIPAYPDAHLSADSFSLIKALSESGDELNKEKEMIMPEDEVEETAEESQEPAQTEPAKEPEAEAEPEKPAEAEEPKADSEKDAKPVTLKDVQEVFAKSLKEALKGSETPRGLVMTEKEVKDKLAEKSIGELAMMQGLFVQK